MVDHEIYTRLGSVQAAETYARQFMNSVNFRSDTILIFQRKCDK